MEKQVLISFQNISKTFKNKPVLLNLNLNIYENEIVALLGKSGCGKSTLLKILIGFYSLDRGQVLYKNENISNNYNKIKNITGFVTQENSFYEKLTIEENLIFFAKLYKVKKYNLNYRINYLLKLVKLENSRKILSDKISGGMKRRLEFAISLVHNPELLILDEPLTGLDIQIRDELWEVLKDIKDSGVTVIISTHLLKSAQEHCSRVVILNNKCIESDFQLNPNLDLEAKFLEVIKE